MPIPKQSLASLRCSGHPVGRRTDADLLGDLIGVSESIRQYKGYLQPFFGDDLKLQSYKRTQSQNKCYVARELVKRWLSEEMKRKTVLSHSASVTDYLKIHFAGREYESFVVLFLDAQNCLIEVE